jgi:hypothetical protein
LALASSRENAETGGTLKPPVKAGDNPRRASFLARMGWHVWPDGEERQADSLGFGTKGLGRVEQGGRKVQGRSNF